MLKMMLPEKFRLTNPEHPMSTKPGDTGGVFVIPLKSKMGRKPKFFFHVIVSDQYGWNHLAVTKMTADRKTGKFDLANKQPTFQEMEGLKEMFFAEGSVVMQVHIPEKVWENKTPMTLHLWEPKPESLKTIPIPSPLRVGVPGVDVDMKTGKVTQITGESLDGVAVFRTL